jgi:branched-chain amino acid transport system ATP-binding protein
MLISELPREGNMLELIDVNTHYGPSHILQGVSLKVEKGTVVALVGRNGVGKTTTMHTIVGFCQPSSGKILFEREDIGQYSAHKIARTGISLVPQGRRLFPSLTVREHLEIALRKKGGNDFWDLDRAYSLFPVLKEKSGGFAGMLSGGEQQMLAIARALVTNPTILLLDEPSEGLAPLLVQEVYSTVRALKERGLAILLVDQNIQDALEVSNYVYVMNKGKIVYESIPEALQNNDEIKNKYLGV